MMDPRRERERGAVSETALASDIFDKFCSANTLKGILCQYRQLCSVIRLKPTHFPDFYPRLRVKLCSWRAQGLWSKFEKRASQKCYGRGKFCHGTRVLIIGAGPCGLRAAIEAQLLGAKVVVVEKRDRFSRNNVLHLWPFVIADLKALGAKKFYGKFCAGSIDHISIRQLQCILLKVALLLGVEIHEGVSFEGLREPTENEGWRAMTVPSDHPVSHYNFDVLIGADGRRNTLEGFKRKALRAKLAIAITANFINKHTEAEARVKEISGVSYIFNQKFFQELNEATGIDLENIVYYKDETHYFVMTAKKQSLLNKGVLLHDYADTAKLLSHENISTEALMIYALEAATFATDYQLPDIEFAVNHYGQPDVAMFDFTAMYAAENACRVVQRKSHKLLMTLVGDSLLEPFWPTGSGCARGFLSSFDAAWMLRSWTSGLRSVLEVVAERESIYRLLGQTTPENLHKEHAAYTIDPHTRYPNLNLRLVMPFQVKSLYEADEQLPDVPDVMLDSIPDDAAPKKRRRDSVIAVDSLLNWLREQVLCYDIQVVDIREAYVEGNVLCAIIHRFRPDLLEFPLASEENVDPLIQAAFRNQLAFDILHQEYGLPHVMSGYDSVQFGSSDFLTLVSYLSQVYEIFRGEIPQTKYFRSESGDELEEQETHEQALKAIRVAITAKHHFHYRQTGKKSRPSSGRESREGESDAHKRHKKRRSEERNIRGAGSTGELRSSVHTLSARAVAKENRRLQDRMVDIQRFLNSMRLLQLNEREGSEGGGKDDDDDDEFNDFSLHLYRQTVPDFDDRKKTLEQKLIGHDKQKIRFGKSISDSYSDPEKGVPELAKNLEAQLSGHSLARAEKQKPKDMIRAIGKIEKSDWNVQSIEKKMAEGKTASSSKKARENKVPRWSREAYDDKREAMKRKMDAAASSTSSQTEPVLDDTLKKISNKLKHGNALEVGQRGCNKVSAMAEQLIHKLERPKIPEATLSKPKPIVTNPRPAFELPKKAKIDLCHFCKERVYVVERMTAEGKFFHRNCFRCEYCNTSLRIGNYVFDREGRYGERFYCTPHYQTVRMYGWKKFDVPEVKRREPNYAVTPTQQQILSEMDERGTTPERVEFENSVDFTSEEDLLSEMDEDEWTDRNFGASIAENTSDEASDLSDEEEVTPEGNAEPQPCVLENSGKEDSVKAVAETSDSDTEVASDEEGDEEEEDEDDDDEEDEYEEDECGGSTTEIETDSEFAEDPPNTVPGSIPTIVVDAPEPLVTKMVDSGVVNKTRRVHDHTKEHKHKENKDFHQALRDLCVGNDVELVKKGGPERQLPVVTGVPKKWEPLATNTERLASKVSLELKKKYMQGGNIPPIGANNKKKEDPAAQKQFRSVLDMISEQQKLLQPAAKPSATMQAFLDGAEKLKNKTPIVPIPLNRNLLTNQVVNLNLEENRLSSSDQDQQDSNLLSTDNGNTLVHPVSPNTSADADKTLKDTNNLIISSMQDTGSSKAEVDAQGLKRHPEEAVDDEEVERMDKEGRISDEVSGIMTTSDTPSSYSMSETETNNTTVINANDIIIPGSGSLAESGNRTEDAESDSDTEVGSEAYSDLDDLDDDDMPQRITHEPPRVEIEDEFGVTKELEAGGGDPKIEPQEEAGESNPSPSPINPLERNRANCLSSSDSSLNSGIFLETEMSDYVKEESVAEHHQKHSRKKMMKKKVKQHGGSQELQTHPSKEVKKDAWNPPNKPALCFDLESLDFADIDGVSSPDDFHGKITEPRNLKPSNHSSIPPPPKDRHFGHETQSPSITSPSEDEEISSSSTRDRQRESATSEAEMSESPHTSDSIAEVRFHGGVFSARLPSTERPLPFCDAKDSMDYRKLRGNGFSSLSSSGASSDEKYPYPESENNAVVDQLEQQIGFTNLSIEDSNVSGNGSPTTTRKIEEIRQERVKQNDLIKSMVMGRIKRSPEKSTRRNSRGTVLQRQTSSSVEEQELQLDSRSENVSNVRNHENISDSSSESSGNQRLSGNYDRVFTSSPRVRHPQKINGSLQSNHSSLAKTEPPTPAVIDYNEESDTGGQTNFEIFSAYNSAMHRSMPNLLRNAGVQIPQSNGEIAPPSYVDPPAPPKSNPFVIPDQPRTLEREDDFLSLHVKIRPSTEQSRMSKSGYSDSSKEYSAADSGYGPSSQPHSSAMTISFHEKSRDQHHRPRANTMDDLNKADDYTSGGGLPLESSGVNTIPPRAKAFSSEAFLDSPSLSEGRRISVPDISGSSGSSVVPRSQKRDKSKDRDRRRSLIQTVSDFFSKSLPSQPTTFEPTSSASTSNITSPSKDKFSLFKLTPKLLQSKERRKSRESILPTKSKSEYGSQNEVDECTRTMAGMSFMASKRPSAKHGEAERQRRASTRAREIQEIQLQLESIEADQRALESKGVKIEKKLRGEEQDHENRTDNEIMEDWFALVREKTKLARFEKELLARAQELELEMRKEQLEEQLEIIRSISDSEKTPLDWQRENEILHEFRRLEDQHSHLLNSIHADMENYNSDILPSNPLVYSLSPGSSRLESDV